jgi:hypothetical protein
MGEKLDSFTVLTVVTCLVGVVSGRPDATPQPRYVDGTIAYLSDVWRPLRNSVERCTYPAPSNSIIAG